MNRRQFQTVLWLRWRLSRNQLARSGPVGLAVFTTLAILGALAAVASAAGGFLLGMLGLDASPASMHLVVWNALTVFFLLFWIMGLIVEVQRAESIQLERFLHLPVSLRQIFLFNYLASHLTPVVLIFLPGMLTLALGLAWDRGPQWLLMIPLVIGFLFCLSSWTYCLRGWLASIMVNQRRRRAIVVGLTMGIILLAQLPNLYLNVLRRDVTRLVPPPPASSNPTASNSEDLSLPHSGTAPQAEPATAPQPSGRASPPARGKGPPAYLGLLSWLPPLWVGHGAMRLHEGAAGPVLAYTGLFLLTGLLGFRTAYRATRRFYTGRQRAGRARRRNSGRPANWLDVDLPFLPPGVGTMSLAFLRSILRAPEMKMALLTPLIVVVLFGSIMLRTSGTQPAVAGVLFPPVIAYVILFGLLQVAANQFGYDRHGFRALVLLPVRRAQIILAKNVALFPVALLLEILGLVVLILLTRAHGLGVAAGLLQFLSGYLLLSMVGNLGSILAPYRVTPGAMKRSKPNARSILANVALHLLFPTLLLPLAAPVILQLLCDWKGWWPGVPVGLIGSTLALALCALLYRLLLPSMGRLLQSREMSILEAVTREVD